MHGSYPMHLFQKKPQCIGDKNMKKIIVLQYDQYLLEWFWSRTGKGQEFPRTPDNSHHVESGGIPPVRKGDH
mgnify:CR=1 FL=1